MCLVSMLGCCHVRPWLIEFSGVELTYFKVSRSTVLTEVSSPPKKTTKKQKNPEGILVLLLFKALPYSVSWDTKILSRRKESSCTHVSAHGTLFWLFITTTHSQDSRVAVRIAGMEVHCSKQCSMRFAKYIRDSLAFCVPCPKQCW